MERHGLHRVPEAALPAVQRAQGPLEELEVAFGRRLEKPPLQRAGTAGEGRRHGRGRGVGRVLERRRTSGADGEKQSSQQMMVGASLHQRDLFYDS